MSVGGYANPQAQRSREIPVIPRQTTHEQLRRTRTFPHRWLAVVALTGCLLAGVCWGQQVSVAPPPAQQVVRMPVMRIQNPGYVPPPPTVRRPWWFTVQTASGPGAVLPVPHLTHYAPQPFRFPAAAPVLAGKPILPPAGTPPTQWAAAPAVMPPPAPAAAPATSPASDWGAIQPPAAQPPVQPPAVTPPVAEAAPPPPPRPASTGTWATVAIDASQPQPHAMAVTIPATPGSLLAAQPAPAATPPASASPPVHHSNPQPSGQPTTVVASTGPAAPAVAWWRCIGVSDGDSISCLDTTGRQQKVHLAGIDAPEPGQPYGQQAREALAEQVFGKLIAVVVLGRDPQGQAICQVSFDGRDISRVLVTAGAAWADPTSGSPLSGVQEEARAARRGLWAEPSPVPPWDYRTTNPGLSPIGA